MQVFVGDRNTFMEVIRGNTGTIVFKFGAEWCEPCKRIKGLVDIKVAELLEKKPEGSLQFFDVDVDDCIDLYAFMKSKRMMRGIPVLLRYDRGNDSFAPDGSISGSDTKDVETFFRMI